MSRIALVVALLAACFALDAHAKKTVCTITVNSADEKDTFRKYLPKEDYQFVELVEKGRTDWLRGSCQRGVQCDVLIISGHFNAGDTFYSDNLANNEYLKVDELERASCSNSCPGLFANLKEVYLFGCESLNPDATKYSSSFGESGRDRMRRLFANVPVIYGFSGPAPVGPTAGALITKYFGGGDRGEIGSGRPSSRMLQQFSFNRMTYVSGIRDSDPLASYRRDVCQFYDERKHAGEKLAFVHQLLRRDISRLRLYFDRIEKALAQMDDADRASPSYLRVRGEIMADAGLRAQYLAAARASDESTVRSRMLQVAHTLGWLDETQLRAESVRLVNDLLAKPSLTYYEVGLVCSLNKDGHLDMELPRVNLPASREGRVTHAAAMACMGSPAHHAQVLRALASGDEKDVQIAQVYLQNRPLTDHSELRSVALGVARMTEPRAQVRALDALGRLHISDRSVLEELTRSFAASKNVNVQRALAEVFIRSDVKALPRPELASVLREHRVRSAAGGQDLVDVLLRKLQTS